MHFSTLLEYTKSNSVCEVFMSAYPLLSYIKNTTNFCHTYKRSHMAHLQIMTCIRISFNYKHVFFTDWSSHHDAEIKLWIWWKCIQKSALMQKTAWFCCKSWQIQMHISKRIKAFNVVNMNINAHILQFYYNLLQLSQCIIILIAWITKHLFKVFTTHSLNTINLI